MKVFRSAHLRNHSGITDRNAFSLATWTFLYAVGATCEDPREPIDAIVATDRLAMKREIARAWLKQRAAERNPKPAPAPAPTTATPTARRLCRVLAFHTGKSR